MNMQETVYLTIEDLTREGDGVGHLNNCRRQELNGLACFVPGALPGEQVEARIVLCKKNFAKAELLRVVTSSPHRREHFCVYASTCGGCGLAHLDYPGQLQAKEKWVRDALTRIGGCEALQVRPIVPAEEPLRYRNKAELAIGNHGEVGFMAAKSHRAVDCKTCQLMPQEVEEAAEEIRAYLAEGGDRGAGKALVRVAHGTDDMMVALQRNTAAGKGNLSLRERYDIWTKDSTLLEYACGLKWEISPDSFFQVNTVQMERLYGVVREFVQMPLGGKAPQKPVILDLYCGIGTIGLTLAKDADHVLGIEAVKPAVLNANRNAMINGIANAEFLCGKAEEVLPKMFETAPLSGDAFVPQLVFPSGFTGPADVVIMDPPRAGCDTKLLDAAALADPERMIYVSCDPATLARDIKYLAAKGYVPVAAQPVDMFPQTLHVETVVLMSRVKE